MLANRSISVKEAYALLGLFLSQFVLGAVLPEDLRELERIAVGVVYLVLAAVIIVRQRGAFRPAPARRVPDPGRRAGAG